MPSASSAPPPPTDSSPEPQATSAREKAKTRLAARLSADDLGAGYAGFRLLVRLQQDIIKLDISLISGIHRRTEKRALTRALVSFAEEVGTQLIAEGVEEPEELSALQELRVPWARGFFLLGRPGPLLDTVVSPG